jgi:hypothetical protein
MNEAVTEKELYILINETKDKLITFFEEKMERQNEYIRSLEKKIDELASERIPKDEMKLANMQGKATVTSTLIGISVNAFFFIMNSVLFLYKK